MALILIKKNISIPTPNDDDDDDDDDVMIVMVSYPRALTEMLTSDSPSSRYSCRVG